MAVSGGTAVAFAGDSGAKAAARVDNPYAGAKVYVNPDWSRRAAAEGELGPTEIDRYKTGYIDPIAKILADSKYANLRIVTAVESDSLPNLVTNTGGRPTATPECDVMKANGNYIKGVGYALKQLGAVPNVYNYVDAGHHGWIGWDDNFAPSAQVMHQAATAEGGTVDNVHGFIANTANYSALKEEHFTIGDTVGGRSVRESKWVDWNRYTDELSFAQAFRDQLVSTGFKSDIGMLIDTSRNAYVWMKPPGESDGASKEIPNNEGKGFDRMCDPTYTGNPRNGHNMSGALPNAPLSGHWFSAQFQELLKNAHPKL
ncbi:glycoside hydrolase family 6 protein [Streptomyces aureoverticillatus]|nr:glycoside hydrolase family 6 protein [Streptomyces aureoverticillatus]